MQDSDFPKQLILPAKLIAERFTIELGAQEPWPNDVKLYQPYEVEQILLPDNANCLAVQAFLRMCQLQYQVEPRANAEAMSPTGKVPFIKCGAFVVSELEGIVQFVNNRGITLTDKLDNEAKSDMRAYMCLVHNVLEKAELYVCWMDKETYNDVTSIRHGSVYPWPLNHIQNWSKRRSIMKNLKVWNWYDKKLEEVFQEVQNACQALSDRLDDKEYFFGSRTELDALVFGHLYSLCTTCLHLNEFQNILKKFLPLVNHCRRICELMGKETDIFDDLLKGELDDLDKHDNLMSLVDNEFHYFFGFQTNRTRCLSIWTSFYNSNNTIAKQQFCEYPKKVPIIDKFDTKN